jgi:MerR family transcriptional regulator/heat shock protein HspR
MKNQHQPLYMIGVAARLCGVHPQTLRQYERLGLISPSRVGAKNRLYSENDIQRIRSIQRLTQQMGINLAGVEVILRLLDEMEAMRAEMERQFEEYRAEAERRIQQLLSGSTVPIRKNDFIIPVPQIRWPRIEL